MSLRVAVVQGGPSSEAEVSRVSARGVAEALRAGGHGVTCLELDQVVRDLLFDLAEPAEDLIELCEFHGTPDRPRRRPPATAEQPVGYPSVEGARWPRR